MTDLMAIASAALGLTLSEPVPLAGSDRSSVLRCRTSANSTVVVKSYPPSVWGAEGFAAERAGLTFIAPMGAGPDLLAADADHRVIVMSDLGTAPSLADLLLGGSPQAAADALIAWARGCGELAARGAGRRSEFDVLVPASPREHWLARRIREIPELLAGLSIRGPGRLENELSEVSRLLTPGQYDVFSPGDLCPDNNLITPDGIKFIDFESAEFHTAFLDAAYLRMPFSTCWCVFRLPDDLARSAEYSYRSLVSGVYPDLAVDEIWEAGVRRASTAWTLHALTYLLDRSLVADEPMNSLASEAPTRRQLLRYRLRWLSEELDQADEFPAISALMTGLLEKTQPWLAPGLRLYPAFR